MIMGFYWNIEFTMKFIYLNRERTKLKIYHENEDFVLSI